MKTCMIHTYPENRSLYRCVLVKYSRSLIETFSEAMIIKGTHILFIRNGGGGGGCASRCYL